ncbi:MAG: response regulator transcription factor [Anaerolineae bacterium]|nr:response regulator transcription factor [Anaerolineae bacterium]
MDQDNIPLTPARIRLVIVDDHPVFRQGLRNIFATEDDIEVLAEASTGEEALQLVHELHPDMLLLDINLPGINGLQVASRLKAEQTDIAVVLLTAYDDLEQVLHAMRSGGAAYCPKDIEPEKLVEVVRSVMHGNFVVAGRTFTGAELRQWLDTGAETAASPSVMDLGERFVPLSAREMEILQFVTRGKSNKEIAQTLGISHQTVKNHMTSILKKLDVRDRTQAAVYALQRGWVRAQDNKQAK